MKRPIGLSSGSINKGQRLPYQWLNERNALNSDQKRTLTADDDKEQNVTKTIMDCL